VNYNKDYQNNKTIMNFLNSLMCNNQENLKYLQKILGYCLTGSTEGRSYFIFYGKGSNGKSLLLSLLDKVLTSNFYKPVSKKVFINSKDGPGGSELLSLKDLRVATFSETNSKEALNESLLKMISGGDKVQARALYREPVEFKINAKLIVCSNHKPEFNGEDLANIDRIKFLKFGARFVDNPSNHNEFKKIKDLDKILEQETNLNDFFSFCVDGVELWKNDQNFQKLPEQIKKEQEQYFNENASFSSWIKEEIIITTDEKDKILRSALYDNYLKFCKDNDLTPLNKKNIIEMMASEFGPVKKVRGDYFHYSIKLKQIEEEEEAFDLRSDGLEL
jgi:putative DNA primase/helicase